MARTRVFSDLDFNFTKHPLSHDVARKFDEEAIKQSIKNLVMTNHYERPFHPEIGSQISALLFENSGPMLEAMLQSAITNTIINFEPRVQLISVDVKSNNDNNAVYASITFKIVNTELPLTVDLLLQRTR